MVWLDNKLSGKRTGEHINAVHTEINYGLRQNITMTLIKWTGICWLVLLLMEGCAMHPETKSIPTNALFDKEGHRGCRGLMPENTIPAMLHAIDLGVTTLEMDVHITQDSLLVLSHDPWMNPDITTRPDGTYLSNSDEKFVLYRMKYDSIRMV